mgnify:CR=1 FL=1
MVKIEQVDTFSGNLTTMTDTKLAIQSIPSLHAFDQRCTTWESYRDRLSFYFKANHLKDDGDMKSLFLWSVGETTYSLLESLVAPVKLTNDELTYEELIKQLDKHFDSTRNIMTASFDFYSCYQKPGQTFQQWKAELCSKLKHCGFTSSKLATKPQDRALRDMYVIGLRSAKIRQALLKEDDPTLEDAERIIQTAERIQADLKHFDSPLKSNDLGIARIYQGNKSKQQQQNQRKQRNSMNKNDSTTKSESKSCDCCGATNHNRNECKYREFTCNGCKRKGHLERVCKQRKDGNPTNFVSKVYTVHSIGAISGTVNQTPLTSVSINGFDLSLAIDTGAIDTIVDTITWHKIGSPELFEEKTRLKCYSGSMLDVQGECLVQVAYNNTIYTLPLIVVKGPRQGLLGMQWITKLKLDITEFIFGKTNSVNSVEMMSTEIDIQELLTKHSMVLNDQLGHCTKIKAHIELKPEAKPKFFKSRSIPFAYVDAVKQEIERNIHAGILQQVDTSDWASPIVPVPKPNGKIRICGDFKVTLNSQILVDQYPIPLIDELLARLNNGVKFSKIDLSDAYLQMELDDESKRLTVINTPMGLFRYNRMPFGIANAPALFQRVIEQVITNVPNCVAYLDDILITGQTNKEHLETLDSVLCRLGEFGFTCNPNKCSFFQDQVIYLGYIIDKNGKRPDPGRIEAILRMPEPGNVKQLEAFLGKVNYYRNFIPNMSTKCRDLNELRRKEAKWIWTSNCKKAFTNLVHDMAHITTLAHFDGQLPVILATDASNYGVGAVLSIRSTDNLERPLAYASRTLTKAETNYSQIEKEALSIIFGIKKFHSYLVGRHFELITDHRPLLAVFNPNKVLPITTANRLQRWALFLTGYTYEIRYKNTLAHANADALSRLPLSDNNETMDDNEDYSIVSYVQTEFEHKWHITAANVAKATDNDDVLRLVRAFTLTSWPGGKDKEVQIKPYRNHRMCFSVHKGCVMKNLQVVIPTDLQRKVLNMLHSSHVGSVRMKQLARTYCWWPTINKDIECLVNSCAICASMHTMPCQKYKSWDEPEEVWSRIHMDFLGPIWNSKYLVVIDAKSKFPIVADMGNNTSAHNLMYTLETIFDWLGPPRSVVTDNGPPFCSYEMQQFFDKYEIQHVTTAPYHPASNGIAERFVRSFKEALTKEQLDNSTDKSLAIRKIVRMFRWTPHSITGEIPAKLLFKHTVRSPFELMKPNETADSCSKSKFAIGQFVWMFRFVRNKRPTWEPAIIIQQLGSVVYLVKTSSGQQHKRHQNQLRVRFGSKTINEDDFSLPDDLLNKLNDQQVNQQTQKQQQRQQTKHCKTKKSNKLIQTVQFKRYPQRERKRPNRF